MMKIFLTGGTGLLGSHFAELALTKGADIISLVRPTSNTAHLKSLGVTLIKGNLRDVKSLILGMKDCDAVVHAASPTGFLEPTKLYEEDIVGGTKNVITAMEANSVKNLVYISTLAVHGIDPIKGKPISEADGFGKHFFPGKQFLPYSYYSRAKIKAEKIVKEAHEVGKIQATVLRPGWLYGPRDNHRYGRLADAMRQGKIIKVGNGKNRLPLVHVGNVAKAIWLALIKKAPEYRVYLCVYDGKITQNEFFESLVRAANTKRRPISLPKSFFLFTNVLQELVSIILEYRINVLPPHYLIAFGYDWNFDQSHIERDLGYSPEINYEKGFAMTEEWYQQSHSIKK
jgi:nucleoside-diphosphate-sugar epimerase